MYLRLFFVALSIFSASYTGARPIEVAAGWDKPPYIISNTHSGFELDLVNEILTSLNHTMVPVYIPLGRTTRMVTSNNVDIGLTLNIKHAIDRDTLSDVYVVYQNVAVTLASRGIELSSVQDLRGHTILAFQTASQVLGEEYRAAVKGHPGYLEIPQQQRQVSMLLLGSVDVVVMDRNVFTYFKNQLPEKQQHATTVHELFSVSPYRAGIPDAKLRQQFNLQLQEIKENGRYQQLLNRYDLINLLHKSTAQ